jgi:hypothetical protein
MESKAYNLIVYTGSVTVGNRGFVTYHKQNNIARILKYFDGKYPAWLFATVYDAKTKQKIEVIKRK